MCPAAYMQGKPQTNTASLLQCSHVELCSEVKQSQSILKDLGVKAFHTALAGTVRISMLCFFFFVVHHANQRLCLCVKDSEQCLYSYSFYTFLSALISLPFIYILKPIHLHLITFICKAKWLEELNVASLWCRVV